MTIPQLRKSFDHMDNVVEGLRKVAHHSFSDAVVQYREEWRKTFKRDLSPADAQAYLKFRFGIKSGKTRRARTRGGGLPLAGAPLDYQTRPGVDGVYGQFPTQQLMGLDRYYQDSLSADCGKPNNFPTSAGRGVTQGGGGWADGLFRPLAASAPVGVGYQAMMEFKGAPPFPTSDPVGNPPLRFPSAPYISDANVATHIRRVTTDIKDI